MQSPGRVSCSWRASRTVRRPSTTDRTWTDGRRRRYHNMTEVRNRPEKNRFEITVDGEVAGYTEYRSAQGLRAFVHTVIEERFEGKGLAAELVAYALEATRTEGL